MFGVFLLVYNLNVYHIGPSLLFKVDWVDRLCPKLRHI